MQNKPSDLLITRMHGWCCKCIRECKHWIQALSSWWTTPCRSCQLAWAIAIRTWTVPNNTADLLSELGSHHGFPEDPLWGFGFWFFLVLIKYFQNRKKKTFSICQDPFYFPHLQQLDKINIHLSYIWPIVQSVAKNAVAHVAKKRGKLHY